MQFDVGLLIII